MKVCRLGVLLQSCLDVRVRQKEKRGEKNDTLTHYLLLQGPFLILLSKSAFHPNLPITGSCADSRGRREAIDVLSCGK